jgi:ubiquinone/menaquinone biosynthesis C-methylase UbiE/cytosine/adenosine deaminase-related metal-dependent hydrolase
VTAATELAAAVTGNAGAFDAWAEVYDRQENPLLALEERYLPRLLPDCKERHILDVGCGTGRWLTRLARSHPASLHGVDGSPKMLEAAAAKGVANTRLDCGELPSLPVASASADLVLASFVLSYVEDLDQCASELARVLREDGDLYLSDMHPGTSAALGWKRGFETDGVAYRLTTQTWPLARLIDAFTSHGFTVAALLEPPFGELERYLFQARGKEEAWRQAAGRPAIYLLHLRKLPQCTPIADATHTLHLSGAQCALGAQERLPASIAIEHDTVASIMSGPTQKTANRPLTLDLNGYLLFPGLVNAHDHLEFALFPRLGSPPYKNATQWAHDIQESSAYTIALHQKIPKDIRLWWGAVRNLLCGVTTVCEHNPLHPALQDSSFPVRVVKEYGWEHSIAFAKDIPSAMKNTDDAHPFFIHACEGIDDSATAELHALDAMGALEERSVLVHGLALDAMGADLLNQRHAALVICPSSNNFLFQTTHTLERLRSIERLALGSDSPLTADGDLLDELRFARNKCGLRADELYPMVTDRSARIVRPHRGEGTLRVRSVADIIAISHRPGSPAEVLSSASWRDIEFVLIGGEVKLASPEIFDRLPAKMRHGLLPLKIEDELRWLRAPVPTLLEAAENVLGTGNVYLGGLRIARAAVEA